MKAGFIQFSPEFGKTHANIDKAISMIEKTDAELIVLPELFNIFADRKPEHYLDLLKTDF